MKVAITAEAAEAIKQIANQHEDKPNNVRVYVAGMGWSGPSFGLALDEQKEDDLLDDSNEVKFIMEKDLYETFGDITIDQTPRGFTVTPSKTQDSACGSCGGGCE